MDAPWPGPWLALGLNFEASAGAGHKILGWPLAWPWLALGLALPGPWPGPWLALGLALGWPLAWPLASPFQTGSGSNREIKLTGSPGKITGSGLLSITQLDGADPPATEPY